MRRRSTPHRKQLASAAVAAAFALLMAGCDPSSEGVTVKNLCGETLRISITEYPQGTADERSARYEAREYGVDVAPGASHGEDLMRGAGGYLVAALADDDRIFFEWRDFAEPREISLSDDLGTCPHG